MKFKYAVVMFLVPVLSVNALAGEQEDGIINKVVEAYGGDALLNLTTIQVDDHFKGPSFGQNWSPELEEITTNRLNLSIDLEHDKVSYETWNEGRSANFQAVTIVNGEKAHRVNFSTMSYGDAPSNDMYAFAGSTLRTTDAFLVWELNRARQEVKYQGDENYLNRPHMKLLMPFPQSPDLTLYIDSRTHLISRMVRNNPQFGDLDYVFSRYRQSNGITYAGTIHFFIGGSVNIISIRHDVEFNEQLPEDLFELPDNVEPEGERIDTSEMVVNRISDRIYHLGTGNAFSIFIDTSEGIVAAGGYPALKGRFERFKAETGVHKALKYQIVTHHHSDHVAGLGDAVTLGARLVTVQENIPSLRKFVPVALDDWQFFPVGPRTTIGDGRNRIEIYEVSTIHSKSFLVTYIPSEKMVFIADHMGSPYKMGIPVATLSTVDMLKALESLDIDVRKIATAHNARIFTFKEMQQSVAEYAYVGCAKSRSVCL